MERFCTSEAVNVLAVFPCLCLNLSAPVFLHVFFVVCVRMCVHVCVRVYATRRQRAQATKPHGAGTLALDGGCQHWFSRDDFPRTHLTTCHPTAAASVYAHLSARDSHSVLLPM